MTYADRHVLGSVSRRPWLRIAAGLFAVFWGFIFYGVLDLFAFAQGADFHAALVLSTGWGLLFLFLTAAPLVVMSAGPRSLSGASSAQVLMVGVALAIAAVISSSPRFLFPAVGIFVTVGVLTAAGAQPVATWLTTWQVSAVPLVLVALAAGPFSYYAWTSARNTGTPITTDDTLGLDHWPAQAALPIAALLIAVLAAGHPHGWRVPAWSVGAAGAWFAVVCWIEPHLVASMSRPWSAALFLWSIAFVAVIELTDTDKGAHHGR